MVFIGSCSFIFFRESFCWSFKASREKRGKQMAWSFGANGYKSLPWERHVSIIHAGLKASRTVQNLRAFPRLMTLSVFRGLHNLSDLSRATSRARSFMQWFCVRLIWFAQSLSHIQKMNVAYMTRETTIIKVYRLCFVCF